MRFGLFTAILTVLIWSGSFCLAAHAQDLNIAPEQYAPLQTRGRGATEGLRTADGLEATRYAGQLGQISAITLSPDGTIYTADEKSGRVFKITDRDKNGIRDQVRSVGGVFSQPSGLAVTDAALFVADSRAIWAVPLGGGPRRLFVSLANTQAFAAPRPMLLSPDGKSLRLAVSSTTGGRIISVRLSDGRASLLASGAGPISALAQTSPENETGALWASINDLILPVTGDKIDLARAFTVTNGVSVTGLMLPGQFKDLPSVFKPWNDQVLAAQGRQFGPAAGKHSGGRVLAIATEFGQLTSTKEVFVDGFVSKRGHAAWGLPGGMVADSRGIFISDSLGGAIWRVSKARPKPVRPAKPKTQVSEKPKTSQDTFGQGSLIGKASTLETGSTIIDRWEKEQAEQKEKEAKEKAEKESLSDALDDLPEPAPIP